MDDSSADKPDDWVVATGNTSSVREFLKLAFKYVDVDIEFSGKGIKEKGIVSKYKSKFQI